MASEVKLFEAILDANQRALSGDASAGIHPSEFADELPVVALTCIDPRLNPLFPEVLGLPKEQFIWLRNAGNIITSPLSSTMRSLALACAVKGGREIAIIGHTDCQVCKTSTMNLTDAFSKLGIDRAKLPENLTEFFGMFASERQNVIKAVEFTRHSPLIGPRIPVHGLVVDITTGKLEWVVNGYQSLELQLAQSAKTQVAKVVHETEDAFKSLADFKFSDIKFPETKIGELAQSIGLPVPAVSQPTSAPPVPPVPPLAAPMPTPKMPPAPHTRPMAVPPVVQPPPPKRIPVPPPVRPTFRMPKDRDR